MLAGATGIDVLLLVVAADEGVMPQTREHAAIAELLGVHRAVVALTKVDLVGDEWLGLVHDDLADFLADTPFAGAPVIPTSTVDGTGIDAVREAIEDTFAGTRGRPDDLFRLPVDRTFTVKGTGTVVTGTVWSGTLAVDAAVRLLPDGVEARVRGLQVHGGDVERVEAGQRAAVALAGVDRDAVERGATVVAGPGWAETDRVTGSLRVLPGRWSVEPWQRVRVHLGTAEVMARTVLLGDDRLDPGRQGLVQLRLEAPLVARAGDRFVIRSYSPVTTIGGGVVLEPLAPKRTRLDGEETFFVALDDPDARIPALLDAAGEHGVERERLPIVSGLPPDRVDQAIEALETVSAGGAVFPATAADAVRERVLDAVDAHHRQAPLQPGIDPAALRRRAGEGSTALIEHVVEGLLDRELVMRRGAIGRTGYEPELTAAQERLRDRLVEALAEAGVAAPRLDELRERLGDPAADDLDDLVTLLEARDTLVRVEHDLFLHADAVDEAVARIRERLAGRVELSPGDFRDVLGVSRRHLIPLLEYFDRVGVTAGGAEGRVVA
jgi:selenocysteine-specific elongation factor